MGEELKGNRALPNTRGKKRPVGGGDSPALPPNPRMSQQGKTNPGGKKRKRADNEENEQDKKQKTKNENEDTKKRKREEKEQETEPEDYYKRNQGDRDGKPRAGVG